MTFQHRLPNAPPGWDVLTTEEVEALIDSGQVGPFSRQWGQISSTGDDTMKAVALLDDLKEQGAVEASIITDDGTGTKFTATSGGKNPAPEAGWFLTANTISLNQLPNFFSKFKIDELDQMRFWQGFTDVAVGPSVDNNCDGGPAVGIIFSTDRPDTNFQFVAHDGTTQTLVDSGVAADTLVHFMRINVNSATDVDVTLYDANFVEQATTKFTSQLMAGTVELMLSGTVTDINDATTFFTEFYAQIDLKGS